MTEEPDWYEQILELQLRRNPEIWAQFMEQEIHDEPMRLGFIYLSPGMLEAEQLAAFLREQTDYEVQVRSQREAGEEESQWLVVGGTQPTELSLELLDDWVEWMVAAGATEGPCAFDGWAAQLQGDDEDEEDDEGDDESEYAEG